MLNGTGPLPGIVARDASQTNWFEVAQAKSPTVSAAKCQTSRPFVPIAVDFPGPRSAAVTILRVESDARHLETPIRFDGGARVCSDRRGYGDADDGLSEDSGERSRSAWRTRNRSAQRIRYRQALSVHDEPGDFHSGRDDVHQVGTSRVGPEDVLIEPQYYRPHRRIAVVAKRDDLVPRD